MDTQFEHFFATMQAMALSSPSAESVCLREQLVMSLKHHSAHSSPASAGPQPNCSITNLPDDVLPRILYYACDCLAFAQLILKRVCKRWNELIQPQDLVLNSPSIARQFIRSWLCKEKALLEPFSAVIDSFDLLSPIVLSVWSFKALHLDVNDVMSILGLITTMKNVGPVVLAEILQDMSMLRESDDIAKIIYETLPHPSYYSTNDVSVLCRELLKRLSVPKSAQLTVKSGLSILNSIVINDVIPDIYEDIFTQVLAQIKFNGYEHIPTMEHLLYGRHEKVVIERLRLAFKNLDDHDSLAKRAQSNLNCPYYWVHYRFLAKRIMDGEQRSRIENAKYLQLFLLAAFLDAEDLEQFRRMLMHMFKYWPGSTVSAFCNAICWLIEKKRFDNPDLYS